MKLTLTGPPQNALFHRRAYLGLNALNLQPYVCVSEGGPVRARKQGDSMFPRTTIGNKISKDSQLVEEAMVSLAVLIVHNP